MILMRKSAQSRVNGYLVEILQTALKGQGFPVGIVDGDFGGKTETSIRLWQKAQGLAETGEVTEVEWRGVTGLEPPSVFDRLMQLLAAYEGTGFTGVIGNFDGAYLTFGIIGFTLKHDLPGLLADIEARIPAEARAAFGTERWETLLAVSRGGDAEKEAFGNLVSVGARKITVNETWRAAFRALGQLTPVRELQLQRAREKYYRGIALRDAARYGATTLNGVGLFFDTAIQNGGVNSKKAALIEKALKKHPGAGPQKRLALFAEAIADGSSKRWREDVLKRRNVFAKGSGVVHGASYVAADWGIDKSPVDLEALKDDHVTLMPAVFDLSAAAPSGPAAPAIRAPVNWLEEVAVDPDINKGLRPVSNSLMLAAFGQPRGDYDQSCKPPTTPAFRDLCAFGVAIPSFRFKLWGLKKAVDSLNAVLADIAAEKPEIFAILDHLGMGCCRFQRNSSTKISNHSWGSAIDLTLEGQLDVRGNGVMQRGILEIAPIFNRHKWYSGATFRTEDAMHMEISRDWLEEHFPDRDPGARVDQSLLSLGDSGPEVIELESRLVAHGHPIAVDGDFDVATLAAVRAFQGAHGLKVDGLVGPKTWEKLRA